MRKVLFVIVAVFTLSSCSKAIYTESVYTVDYREYINSGFTISPTITGFNYQPISNIDVVFTPGNLAKGESDKDLEKVIPYKNYSGNKRIFAPTGKRMMDKIVSEAKKMGANGLIDFKTSYNPKNGTWSASGIAVTIK